MKKYLLFLFMLTYLSVSFAQTETKNSSSLNSLLAGAGAISVTIGGDFIVTGSFPALITERVDQFVTRMFNRAKENALSNVTEPEELKKVMESFDQYSLRDITLKRSDGQTLKIDLVKFRMTGDFSNDPYLKNDDVLIFPPSDLKRNFFSVEGAVNKPGKFHFVDGDKLSDALELAQGINKAYEGVTQAQINRLSYNGEKMSVIDVDITKGDFPLQRGDRIVVAADETQRKDFSVLVAGEVNRPGKIPITKNNTTLKQVIEKAGGLTSQASLVRARLYTGTAVPLLLEKEYGIKLQEEPDILDQKVNDAIVQLEEMMMYRMSNVVPEDTSYFFLENKLRVLTEGSAVDFTGLKDENSQASNYIVKNGDIIIIPQKSKSVYVYGQVGKPGHIDYEADKDYNYYITKAGGLGEYSLAEETMVIKANSRKWVSPIENKVTIEPGDFIYVPREMAKSFNYYVGQIGNYLSIVSSAATILLLLIQFSK